MNKSTVVLLGIIYVLAVLCLGLADMVDYYATRSRMFETQIDSYYRPALAWDDKAQKYWEDTANAAEAALGSPVGLPCVECGGEDGGSCRPVKCGLWEGDPTSSKPKTQRQGKDYMSGDQININQTSTGGCGNNVASVSGSVSVNCGKSGGIKK